MDGLLNSQVNAALLQAQGQEGPRVARVDSPEHARKVGEEFEAVFLAPVSYTHLTLPTILRV